VQHRAIACGVIAQYGQQLGRQRRQIEAAAVGAAPQ
jgi:hypothetical protein